MQSPIHIQKEGNHINVYCTYNPELVEIFQSFNGWWRKSYWMFPLVIKDKLVDTLEEKGYKTITVPEFGKWRKEIKMEFSYDTKTKKLDIQVWGLCIVCHTKALIDKNTLMCEKCQKEA
jgi:sulfite reductase alpha subunit-like flavoprotein